MKLLVLLLMLACKPLKVSKLLKTENETIPFLVTTMYEGFKDEYDEEFCSLTECKDRAAHLGQFTEVKFSICLQNVPLKNTRSLTRKSCK